MTNSCITHFLFNSSELAATFVLVVVQQVLLVLQLDESVDHSWATTLTPWLLLECVWFVSAVARCLRPPEEAMDVEMWRTRSRFTLLALVLQIVFVCLVMEKLDGQLSLSWWTVWLPVWLWVLLTMVKHVQLYKLMKAEQELRRAEKSVRT